MKHIYTVYLHNFNQYNKKNGWDDGDKLLQSFAKALNEISKSDFIFRVYGDDFVILNKEHLELRDSLDDLEKVLVGTGVTMTYKHFDMKIESVFDIKDLEKIL